MRRRTRKWWRAEIQRWEEGGKEAADFAEGKGYSPKTLKWWRAELKRERSEGAAAEVSAVALVPARVVPAGRDGAIWIEFNGVRVEVRRGFDAVLLKEVVGLLREAR
jgi:hypothetical protein